MATPSRDQIFEVMFWHESFYGHPTEALEDGWRCLFCDAKMITPKMATRL
jgi:hypothetical protein